MQAGEEGGRIGRDRWAVALEDLGENQSKPAAHEATVGGREGRRQSQARRCEVSRLTVTQIHNKRAFPGARQFGNGAYVYFGTIG